MKIILSIALLASALAAASPAIALPAAPAPAATQSAASGVVLDSANRILATLDSRRAEFKANPAALNQFIKSEFNRSFDADYAARLVLGVHGRGAPAGDVADFAAAMADSLTARYGSSLLDFNTKLSVKVKSEAPPSILQGGRCTAMIWRGRLSAAGCWRAFAWITGRWTMWPFW